MDARDAGAAIEQVSVEHVSTPQVSLEHWDADTGEALLHRLNAPELMTFLGGPETDEKVASRHRRYLEGTRTGASTMFRVVVQGHPEGVAAIGYWPVIWQTRRCTNRAGRCRADGTDAVSRRRPCGSS